MLPASERLCPTSHLLTTKLPPFLRGGSSWRGVPPPLPPPPRAEETPWDDDDDDDDDDVYGAYAQPWFDDDGDGDGGRTMARAGRNFSVCVSLARSVSFARALFL